MGRNKKRRSKWRLETVRNAKGCQDLMTKLSIDSFRHLALYWARWSVPDTVPGPGKSRRREGPQPSRVSHVGGKVDNPTVTTLIDHLDRGSPGAPWGLSNHELGQGFKVSPHFFALSGARGFLWSFCPWRESEPPGHGCLESWAGQGPGPITQATWPGNVSPERLGQLQPSRGQLSGSPVVR